MSLHKQSEEDTRNNNKIAALAMRQRWNLTYKKGFAGDISTKKQAVQIV